ncbi:hypothetical protein R3P38DRAFT_2584368, partial [Favolaschia claudopus]
ASQGKTRTYNVVDLHNCKDAFSYYTALSRGSSSAGTAIVQGMDASKITKGISGHLRQEFRELEILNEITRRKYEGTLPPDLSGVNRRALIGVYRDWCRNNDEELPRQHQERSEWEDNPMMGRWKLVGADASMSTSASKKRKSPDGGTEINGPNPKKPKTLLRDTPRGLQWDFENYSCAYDVLITCLFNLWLSNETEMSKQLSRVGRHLAFLVSGFSRVVKRSTSLERIRDDLRKTLTALDPIRFPSGCKTTRLAVLTMYLFDDYGWGRRSIKCVKCDTVLLDEPAFRLHQTIKGYVRVSGWLTSNKVQPVSGSCPHCSSGLLAFSALDQAPPLLVFDTEEVIFEVEPELRVPVGTDHRYYDLKGVVYFGDNHFTCRVIAKGGDIWYNDGIETGRACLAEGSLLDDEHESLESCSSGPIRRRVRSIIYALRDD